MYIISLIVCLTKESAARLLLLLLSIDSSRFLPDSLLHLCTSLLFLLSSSCSFLTLSTDAGQAFQGGLRFRLRMNQKTQSPNSLSLESSLEILLFLSLHLKLAPKLTKRICNYFCFPEISTCNWPLLFTAAFLYPSHICWVLTPWRFRFPFSNAIVMGLLFSKTYTRSRNQRSTGCFGSSLTGGL